MDQDRRQIDRELRQWLWDNYFRIMYMPGDGSCLFHAVAHYCYLHGKKRHQGNKVTHTYLRQICCDYMARHKDQFSSFLTDETSFEEHIEQMRSTTKYADNPEIVALSAVLDLEFVVYYRAGTDPHTGFYTGESSEPNCIHLARRNDDHYDLVRPYDRDSIPMQFPLVQALCASTESNEIEYIGAVRQLFILMMETDAHINLDKFDLLYQETLSDVGPFAGYKCSKEDFKYKVMSVLKYWGADQARAAYQYMFSAVDLYNQHVHHHPPSKVGATNRVVVEPLPGTNYTDSDKMADEHRAQDRLDVAAREEKWEEVENWTISDIDNGRTIFNSKRDDDLIREYAELNNSTHTNQMDNDSSDDSSDNTADYEELGLFLADSFFGTCGDVDASSPNRTLVSNKINRESLTPGSTVSPTQKKPRRPLDSNKDMSVETLQTTLQNLRSPSKKPDTDSENQQPPPASSNAAHQQEPPAISRLHYPTANQYCVGAANPDNIGNCCSGVCNQCRVIAQPMDDRKLWAEAVMNVHDPHGAAGNRNNYNIGIGNDAAGGRNTSNGHLRRRSTSNGQVLQPSIRHFSPSLDTSLAEPHAQTPDNYYAGNLGGKTPHNDDKVAAQARGSPQAQAGRLFQQLTPKMLNKYEKHQIIPSCCHFLEDGKELGLSNPKEMNWEEKSVVFSQAGIMAKQNEMYVIRDSSSDSATNSAADGTGVEEIATYRCLAHECDCGYQIKVCRVCLVTGEKGVVAYQKMTEAVGGGLLPIPHSGHDVLPFYHAKTTGAKEKKSHTEPSKEKVKRPTKKYKFEEYPTLDQRKWIAKNHKKNEQYRNLIERMFKDKSIVHYPCQQTTHGKNNLITCVKGWLKKNKKYMSENIPKPHMTLADVKEVLEALKVESSDKPLPKNSKVLFDDIKDRLTLNSHNYGESREGKFTIVLTANDAKEIVEQAVKMFPGGKVQVELDFYHLKGVRYQVGHLGITDYNHKYWVICFAVSNSENSVSALELLRVAVDLVDAAKGKVEFVLVDGGTALKSAVDELNISQKEKDMTLRACFTHKMRLPHTRGGGFRGSKGSIVRGLILRRVKSKQLRQILSLLFDFNFLPPPSDPDGNIQHTIFNNASLLLIKQFEEQIPPEAMEYLKRHLKQDQPHLLGGRAVGRQGQVGSTNGCERTGGWTKNTIHSNLDGVTGIQRNNPIFSIQSFATQISSRDPNDFHSTPVEKVEHYNLLNALSKLDGTRQNGTVQSDVAYLQCFQLDNDGSRHVRNLRDMIGKGSTRSYVVLIPTLRLLYNTAKKMLLEQGTAHLLQYAPIAEQELDSNKSIDVNSNDYKYWSTVVIQFGRANRLKLYKFLERDALTFSHEPKPNETVWPYILRCGSRFPQEENKKNSKKNGSNNKKKTNNNNKKKKGRKKNAKKDDVNVALASLDERKRSQDETDKWGSDNDCDTDDEDNIDDAILDLEQSLDLGDASFDEVLHSFDDFDFDFDFDLDQEEEETMRMMERDETVDVPGELGHWRTITVNAVTKKVHCDCQTCNTYGRCNWVVLYEAIEFGTVNQGDAFVDGGAGTIGINVMVQQAVEVMKRHNQRGYM